MAYFVLAAWVLQGAVGVLLLAGWNRHQQQARVVLGHVGLSVAGLVPWIAFLVTDRATWGWVALGLITVGNTLGTRCSAGAGGDRRGSRPRCCATTAPRSAPS